MLAHPLGLAWMVGAAAYIALAEMMPARYQPLLLIAAGASLALARFYFWHHYIVQAQDAAFYHFHGADQLLLFGPRYQIPEIALIWFALFSVAVDVITRRHEHGLWTSTPYRLELYAHSFLAALLLPEGIRLPSGCSFGASDRAADFRCRGGVLLRAGSDASAQMAPDRICRNRCRVFHFVYQDTATLNAIEVQAEQLVRTLPPNQRIFATIKRLDGSRIIIQHIADRACIGYCFSYGNYEPGSGEFRVRALPGNAYVMPEYDTVIDMEDGSYESNRRICRRTNCISAARAEKICAFARSRPARTMTVWELMCTKSSCADIRRPTNSISFHHENAVNCVTSKDSGMIAGTFPVPRLGIWRTSHEGFRECGVRAYLLGVVILVMSASLLAAWSVYNFTLPSIDGEPTSLSSYKGKVILLVNVASRCGFTPQYSALESIYEKYKDQGFVILGFPANNFGGQEPGTNAEIKNFCSTKYNVTFPMFAKVSVKGDD